MQEEKIKVLRGLIENSTKLEVMGTSRFSEARVLFTELLPAIQVLRKKYPRAGAPKIVARINKVMHENGHPKFKLSVNNLTKWYMDATGERFCQDLDAIARGEKLKGRKKDAPVSRPIFPEEPEPETTVVPAPAPIGLEEAVATTTLAPIGLEEVAGMSEDDLAILEGDDSEPEAHDLATPPDPFGDL